MNGTKCTPEATREPSVSTQLISLDKSVCGLKEVVAALRNRLKPVLREVLKEEIGTEVKEPVLADSPLSGALATLRNLIRQQTLNLKEIIENLEI